MMTDIQKILDRIDQLDQNATKGPWDFIGGVHQDEITHQDENLGTPIAVVQSPLMNTELIAESRTLLPQLATALKNVLDFCQTMRDPILAGQIVQAITAALEDTND